MPRDEEWMEAQATARHCFKNDHGGTICEDCFLERVRQEREAIEAFVAHERVESADDYVEQARDNALLSVIEFIRARREGST
jgi:hypothetical protein